MRNPIVFFIFLVFALLNIADAVTALFILPGEANPLFLLTGSIWIVIILKVIVVGSTYMLYKNHKYPSNMYYYMLVLFLIVGSVLIGFGVYSNVQGIRSPELVEMARNMPASVKTAAYISYVKWMYVLPMSFCLVSFYIYDKTRKNVIIDKKYAKFKVWWSENDR